MPARFNVFDCTMIDLPGEYSRSGTVTPVANHKQIPFQIARTYYLYDIPGGASRGGHAHKNLEHLIVAVCGCFDITLDDGVNRKTIHMSKSGVGLFLRPGIWREIDNFSSGAICLALVSLKYEEEDYIRNYNEFKAIYGNN
jgi:WxcM-like, C-terminal